ncbi:DUF3592 domain-containing protein [Sphingomonas bacterium]|uniref:DUF3592 domain-containing protein n=1 Tax=Sphingomonas bacterium TaxID=1895847 RepID=UPI0015764A52|nr:DUF3592 domain-containing protein [Sphingomonas bacterium]
MGAAIFLLIGIATLLVGAWQGWTTARFVQRASTATGHVVTATAHPAIEFRAAGGAVIRYRQNGMGARPVGTPVRLIYDPADPAGTATAGGFWQLWFPVLGPLLLGAAFVAVVVFGVGIRIRSSRY